MPAQPHDPAASPSTPVPSNLRADCSSCVALCCVVPAFSASADFAFSKPAGRPCRHLAELRCSIHSDLRREGLPGCSAYDCFGAGQKVSRSVQPDRNWAEDPPSEEETAVFHMVRALHELLRYLHEARALRLEDELAIALDAARRETEALTRHEPARLAALDLASHRGSVNALLVRASDQARQAVPERASYRGVDLVGANLRGAALRGADLRGALLVGADLRHADLRLADVTGADLRGARLHGADLTAALFLLESQLAAATGDGATRLSAGLERPAHWARAARPR